MGDEKPVVFVVDDDPAVCSSIAALAQSNGLASATYASAEAFLGAFDRSQLGCLVTDVRMTGMSGLNLLERFKAEKIDLPAVVISGYGDVPMAVEAMRAGAVTFLEKPCRDGELWENVCRAIDWHRGHRRAQAERAEIEARLARLTPEENQVLDRLVAGQANKAIAAKLGWGLRTVESRRANVMKKMGADSLAELVQMVLLTRQETDEP